MPLDRYTLRDFYRRLYAPAGMLETVTFRSRGRGQNQGTGTNNTLFGVRQKKVFKTGQNIDATPPAGAPQTEPEYCVFQIPREELDRVGITDPKIIDTITQENGQVWQIESSNLITIQALKQMINVECQRLA